MGSMSRATIAGPGISIPAGVVTGLLAAAAAAGAPAAAADPAGATDATRPAEPKRALLVGYAVLPTPSLPGPTSGQFIEPANGVAVPFARSQPVQGISAVIPAVRPGHFLALQDNGFGARANSADAVLRWFELQPRWRTGRGGTGTVELHGAVQLADPAGRMPYPVVSAGSAYPASAIPVGEEIRAGHLLTGADLDPESFRQASDGSFWIGDEFGPWLLHLDARGRLLEPPVGIPGVRSPEHPEAAARGATLRGSRGLEGLALSPDGRTLWPMLEGTVAGDPEGTLRIYEFDTGTRTFARDGVTGEPRVRRYRLAAQDHAIGELTALDARRFIVIERDGRAGAEAEFKRIYRIDLDELAPDGTLAKTPLVDLLEVADPDDLDRDGSDRFRFPFATIESVLPIDAVTLLVASDNNFPFGAAREPGTPDATEFILLRVPQLHEGGATAR
jgi:hypothetical protein